MTLIQILIKTGDILLNMNGFSDIDFHSIVSTFRKSLENELDFRKEVLNGEICAKNFKQYNDIHIPKYYTQYCSKRVITMEFVEGVRINDAEAQKRLGINPLDSAEVLNRAMAEMIFKYGHVHCDAHPGNILIRNHPDYPNKPQLILLDHGMYRHYSKAFIYLYAKLFLATLSQNYDEMYTVSKIFNLEAFARFLPLILLWKRSDTKLGENMPRDKKKLEKMRNEHRKEFGGLKSINKLLKDMPENMMFIMRASNLIGLHNMVLGGNNRGRLIEFGRVCIQTLHSDEFNMEAQIDIKDELLQSSILDLQSTLDQDNIKYGQSAKELFENSKQARGVYKFTSKSMEIRLRFTYMKFVLWLAENLMSIYKLFLAQDQKLQVF